MKISFSLLCVFLLMLLLNCNEAQRKSKVIINNQTNKSTTSFNIKPTLKRHGARVDSTIKFNNNTYTLVMYQRVVKEEAVKMYLNDDTIYCNQSQVELFFYKNHQELLSSGFKRSTFEWLLNEKCDSLVWGHKGIDSVTNDGIFVTLIIYKPIKNQYYNIQFAVDLFGTAKIWHVFDNINGNNNNRFTYELNNVNVKINPRLPEYSFYLYTHDDTTWTYYDSVSVFDENKIKLQTIYFSDDDDELSMRKQYAYGLEFLDLNFDNYLDMRLFVTPGSSNYGYMCWLYNKKNNLYEYNNLLSELVNVEVDTTNKLLKSYYRSGIDEYDHKTYKYINDILVLIERELVYGVYEEKPQLEKKYLIEEKYKRINGNLRLISKKTKIE